MRTVLNLQDYCKDSTEFLHTPHLVLPIINILQQYAKLVTINECTDIDIVLLTKVHTLFLMFSSFPFCFCVPGSYPGYHITFRFQVWFSHSRL